MRWLLQPASDTAGLTQDAAAESALRRMGVSEEEIAAGREVRPDTVPQGPPLWAWHEDAMAVFGAMRNQWRTASAGMAGSLYVGLDMGCLGEVRLNLGIAPSPELLKHLRIMETAGLEVLNASANT